jgi:DNA-binding NarL/FixJ family response regulator
MKPIRVMLVDDHDIVRNGIKSLLEVQPDIEVIAEASNGAEAIAKAEETHPDVAVIDITMPVMDGLEATRQMQVKCPDCLVLTLTVHESKQYFFEMLAAGAKGYITKQAAGDELVAAIRAVAAGNVYLQPALASWLLEDYQQMSSRSVLSKKMDESDQKGLEVLSNREREVLELVAEGFTTVKIGKMLEISPNTIYRHRDRIMKKLNITSSAELVKFAIRTGLIDI